MFFIVNYIKDQKLFFLLKINQTIIFYTYYLITVIDNKPFINISGYDQINYYIIISILISISRFYMSIKIDHIDYNSMFINLLNFFSIKFINDY